MLPIIDIHAHAFADKIAEKAVAQLAEHYELPITGTGSVDSLMSSARSAGVNLVVMHAAATKPHQVTLTNDWVSSACRCHTDMIGFGTIHIGYENIDGELNRLVELGLSGLKLHTDFQGFDADDEAAFPIYEFAEHMGIVIMFHCGDRVLDHSSPRRIAKVLTKYPRLKAVVAHMGGVFKWNEARKYIAPLVANSSSLYVDTSSALWMVSHDDALRLLELYDPSQVIFGTDYPIRGHAEELAFLLPLLTSAGLSAEEIASILAGNALRLLGLDSVTLTRLNSEVLKG